MNIRLLHQDAQSCTVAWNEIPGASAYRLCWSDRETDFACYKRLPTQAETSCVFRRVTDRPYRLRTEALDAAGRVTAVSDELVTPVHHVPAPQLEKLNRGLVAVRAATGVFLSWRLMRE